ncbi:Cyclin-L2 [Podochytrium sp. JEL0797]|nr:Cyclin-L2 [Podochytrium sp. JEL0797]
MHKSSILIANLGCLLKLPQTAIATAQTIYVRFFHMAPKNQYTHKDIALAAVFLASKVEECNRSIRDIVNVYFALEIFKETNKSSSSSPTPTPSTTATFIDVPYDTYNEYKSQIIHHEIHILARLGFNVHVQHAHGFMVNYLQSLGLAGDKLLVQYCWNCLNDLGRTQVVVHHDPNVIACAAIFYGCRKFGVALPTSPPWWELFDAEEEDVLKICEQLVELYEIGGRESGDEAK